MKKQKFTETQIVAALKQHEGGRAALDVCQEYGISRATLYNWRKKYSGINSTYIRELQTLQAENRRLTQMYAELMLDPTCQTHKLKKVILPSHKKQPATSLAEDETVGVGRACRVIDLNRSLWYNQGIKDDT